MINLIKILLISFSILNISCSSAALTDKLARGPTLIIQVQQEHIYKDASDKDSFEYDTEAKIIIEAITPVTCTNETNGKFENSHCALDEDQPLPEKIEFRYGVWLSNEEADKLYPPTPYEDFGNNHYSEDYESMDEYLAEYEIFRRKINNEPKYKKIQEAKRTAMENETDWHTYTIYPRQMMQKYHNDMGFINRLRASIVYYNLTFHYDMSVTEKDSILYLDPAVPW